MERYEQPELYMIVETSGNSILAIKEKFVEAIAYLQDDPLARSMPCVVYRVRGEKVITTQIG